MESEKIKVKFRKKPDFNFQNLNSELILPNICIKFDESSW